MFIPIYSWIEYSLRTESKPYLGQKRIINNKVGSQGTGGLCKMTWNLAYSWLLASHILRQKSSYDANLTEWMVCHFLLNILHCFIFVPNQYCQNSVKFLKKRKKKSKTQDILCKKAIDAKRINTRFLKYARKQMKPTWQNGSKTHITSIKVELPEECLACHSKEEKKVYINLSIIHITLGYCHQKAAFRDSAADCHFLTLLPGRFA